MRTLTTTLLCVLCFFCASIPTGRLEAQEGSDVNHVSMIRLIANPDQFNGKIVQVKGYVHLGFEENAVYLHEEDYVERLHSNSLYLDAYTIKSLDRNAVSDHYCRVEGEFHQSAGGLRSGSIDKIQRLENYESR